MGKMELIKTKLASLLIEVKCETVKTDKAVLEYDGELVEGAAVYVTPEGAEERIAAEDGVYTTEDNKEITVEGGKIVSIVEKEEEKPEETPTEESEPTEEVAAEEIVEETPTEEIPTEDAPTEEIVEEVVDEVAELNKRVDELTNIVGELVANFETFKNETLSKLSMSAAKPIEEEFEVAKTTKKTGDSKVDRFLERYGNK